MSPQDKALFIRLSEEDRRLLKEAARKAGFDSVSAFIRSIAKMAEKPEKNSDEQDTILAEIRDYVKKILEKMDK